MCVCVGILSATLKPQCANLHTYKHTHIYVCMYVRTHMQAQARTHSHTHSEQTQYFLKYNMDKCLFFYIFFCSVFYVCVTRRLCVLDSVSRLILSLKLVDWRRCPRRGILLLLLLLALLPVANYGPAQCRESSPISLFHFSLCARGYSDWSRIHFN